VANHYVKICGGWDIIKLWLPVKVIWLVKILAKSAMCQFYLLSRPIKIFDILQWK
jgi:hypothetical protein